MTLNPEDLETKVVRAAIDAFNDKLNEGLASLASQRVFEKLEESGPHVHTGLVVDVPSNKTFVILTLLKVTSDPKTVEQVMSSAPKVAKIPSA